MASIDVVTIQKYTETLKDWLAEGESPARECLVIKFKTGDETTVIDEDMVNETLYLQSRNGNVVVQFDKAGQVVSIEIV